MTEQQDIIAGFEAAGVLAGVRWAYASATSRTLEVYNEADGHDAAWLGNTRFTLFRDRLDRAFACERYVVPPNSSGTVSLDVLHAELSKRDIATMPHVPPGTVRRSDLTGSPGWAYESQRFLLASCGFGGLDSLPWPRKSRTKQRVARQPTPEPPPASLFDDVIDDEIAGLIALATLSEPLDMDTFVVGHTLDALSQAVELVFGRPRINSGGGKAWQWSEDLLGAPPAPGGRRTDDAPAPTSPDDTPDAPVRLRRAANEQPNSKASGDA